MKRSPIFYLPCNKRRWIKISASIYHGERERDEHSQTWTWVSLKLTFKALLLLLTTSFLNYKYIDRSGRSCRLSHTNFKILKRNWKFLEWSKVVALDMYKDSSELTIHDPSFSLCSTFYFYIDYWLFNSPMPITPIYTLIYNVSLSPFFTSSGKFLK